MAKCSECQQEKPLTDKEKKEKLKKHIEKLEDNLGPEPSDQELIEHGMVTHQWYQRQQDIEELKEMEKKL